MYTLYKNPIQLDTLYIVQYLYSIGIILLPSLVIERNYPQFVTDLPSIVYNNNIYNGIEKVIAFYEEKSGIDNLLEKAKEFKMKNPKYTIKN